jgi:hypothetical protein
MTVHDEETRNFDQPVLEQRSSNVPETVFHQNTLENELLYDNFVEETNRTEPVPELQTSVSIDGVKQSRTDAKQQQQQVQRQNEETTASETEVDDVDEYFDVDYDSAMNDQNPTRSIGIDDDSDRIENTRNASTTSSSRETAIVNDLFETNEEVNSDNYDVEDDLETGLQLPEEPPQQSSSRGPDQMTQIVDPIRGIRSDITNNTILDTEHEHETTSANNPATYNVDAVLVIDGERRRNPDSRTVVGEPLVVDAEPIIDTNFDTTQQQQQRPTDVSMNLERNRSKNFSKKGYSILHGKKWRVLICITAVALLVVIITVSLRFSRKSNVREEAKDKDVPDETVTDKFSRPSNVFDVSTYNYVTRHGLLCESHIDCDNTTIDMEPYIFMRVFCGNTRLVDGLEALKLEQWSSNLQCIQDNPNSLMCNATLSRNVSKFAAVLICGRQEIVLDEPIATVQTLRISGTQCLSEPSMKIGIVRLCSTTNSSKSTLNKDIVPSVVDDYYTMQSSMGLESGCPFTDMVKTTSGNWSFCKTQQPCPSISGYPCPEKITLPGVTAIDNMHNIFGSSIDEVCPMTYEPLNETAMWSQFKTIFQQSGRMS